MIRVIHGHISKPLPESVKPQIMQGHVKNWYVAAGGGDLSISVHDCSDVITATGNHDTSKGRLRR